MQITHFTKYSEKKFEILNRHKVYFTKEQVMDVVSSPDSTGMVGKCHSAEKDGVKVLYKTSGGNVARIITFYPVK